jgi:superfamily II DNA or RNA helicase
MSQESSNLVAARFDEFQAEAVGNLLSDFKEKREGRFLLVIPTGGGKTFTAVKAVNKLFADGVLDPECDRVFWGAHRKELITQAKETFEDYAKQNPQSNFGDLVEITMMGELLAAVKDRGGKDALVIIDEAHHAIAGNVNYGKLFTYPDLGILGLTATPSRHDGEPLDFDKESYSIGFPDLVERQIILSPEIHEVAGGRFEGIAAKGASTLTNLDDLNDQKRDEKIISWILSHRELYKKVIIYVGGKKHVKALHQRIKESSLAPHYESVDYILGGNDHSGNDSSRDEFIARIKEYERAIIINCDVLTEGYDDPKANTAVMAAPTRSKLVYMQAIGRCIRVNKNDLLKKAFVVEVEDELPNVRYRINNRWLFSEISDTLEPAVEDRSFSSAEEFKEVLTNLWAEYGADVPQSSFPVWDKSKRYSALFFKYFARDRQYKHLGILIDNNNRTDVSSWFNFLSERMARFTRRIHYREAMAMARAAFIPELGTTRFQQLIYEAMEAAQDDLGNQAADKEYWITFVSLRYKAAEISNDLLEFLDSTVNRDQLIEQIKNRAFRPGDFLVKLPLPLAASIGMIVPSADCELIKDAVDQLATLRSQRGSEDHSADVNRILEQCVLPVPPMYLPSLTSIVREDVEYYFQLD